MLVILFRAHLFDPWEKNYSELHDGFWYLCDGDGKLEAAFVKYGLEAVTAIFRGKREFRATDLRVGNIRHGHERARWVERWINAPERTPEQLQGLSKFALEEPRKDLYIFFFLMVQR